MTERPKVMVALSLDEDALKRLREVADVDIVPDDSIRTKEGLLKVIDNYDGAIVGLPPFDREVINKAHRLKVISRHGVGYDSIDVRAANEKGIVVTITPANAASVAEIAFGLMIAVARKIPEAHFYIKDKRWSRRASRTNLTGVELSGKTLGILGLGRIGSRVAKIGKGFDMKLGYYDIVRKRKLEKELPIERRSLDQLLSESDFVSVHVPLTDETRGMIGGKELKTMKRDAILINTARGPIVDEQALYHALKEKWIAAAGLDVFKEEPINQDNPLLELDNVVFTPHVAGSTNEARRRCAMMAVENTIRVLQGKKPENAVTS
ncbi:hydroxyacid dehydrogenase [Candidatus Bathyarchaeota archaeon]|nr:hydroxyacid dehydrogenase [Candidatus Bathyarchaeota archaeon]